MPCVQPSPSTAIPFLFRAFPALTEGLAHVRLVERPTPVVRLHGMERVLGASAPIHVKRDDLTAQAYGGNKVRKLEFLLAAARAAGAAEVLTVGAAGSNHALATAVHARALGLRSISMLVAQVNARAVRRNLLASWNAGAELHHYPDEARLQAGIRHQTARHAALEGRAPWYVAGGGSSPLGALGFVDAAFELKAQIDAGLLPAPQRIYVALGTTGTAAGLRLGLDAAGLGASRIVAVRVVREDIGNARRLAALYAQAAALLVRLDPAFPRVELDPATVEVRHEHAGECYALYTPAGQAAVAAARASDGLVLEGTYTGKTFAALIDDLRGRTGGPVLYWHTYTRPLPPALVQGDYRALPRALHRYFEEEVQPLDRA
jgi:1-aminocyclopropane-1-carboxylate deaminase/D-cysteine desulfhydrase-like pyridoxal-dependent ACC family enzyme